MPDAAQIYAHLKQIRTSKTLSLKPTPMLRTEIIGLDGSVQPFNLRYYQSQGIYHLLMVPRMVLGDGTGLGKTVQVLGALCYLWDRTPDMRAIVICPKSAIRQWGSEIEKFTTGIKPFIVSGSGPQRKAIYEAWAAAPTTPGNPKPVLVLNYHILVRDWDADIQKAPVPVGAKVGTQKTLGKGLLDRLTSGQKLTLIYDEATAFKNPATKTHQTCKFLSTRAARCWGLTATLLKNNLIEGFGIFQVITPGLFTNKTAFMNAYCVCELQTVKGGAKVSIIVGYKNLADFRAQIDPYFYGRPKHLVSSELPSLTTKEILCELSPAEDRKYSEALGGLLTVGGGNVKDFRETRDLTALIYCQEVVNSLALLGFEDGEEVTDTAVAGKSAKEEALLDLLEEELQDEKVIIYTRFSKLVTRLQTLLTAAKIPSVRITGKESDKDRQKAQAAFQNVDSKVKVIFITDAGSEAINLQAAGAMVFFDTPWSWGNYVQLLGRMIRIGSVHQKVYAIHLIAERPKKEKKQRETIDHKVLKGLRKKKGMIDQIIGEAAVGALKFERDADGVKDLMNQLREDARGT